MTSTSAVVSAPYRWRLADAAGTLSYDGGHSAMLFNPSSWATHRVSPLVLCVVDALRSGPQFRDEVLDKLSSVSESEEGLAKALDDALRELENLNIIVPEPATAARDT